MKQMLIGIDVGTSVIKCGAYDVDGVELCVNAQANACAMENGRSECSMESLWTNTAEVVRTTLSDSRLEGYAPLAASVSGNMIGLWMLDRSGRPFRPAILWNDGRSADILQTWKLDGRYKRIFDISCNVMNPGFTVPLLRWMVENSPRELEQASTLFFCKDWIRFKLTGELLTEETDLSHIPGDVRTRKLSDEVFSVCGVSGLQTRFAPLAASTAVTGRVTREACRLTGLPFDLPVATGLADVSASILGAGGVKEGDRTLVMGTSCLCSITLNRPVFEPRYAGISFLLPGGKVTRTLPNQTGMIALDWFVREFLAPPADGIVKWNDLERVLDRDIPEGSDGLIFHPYLNSTGVVAPVYEPKARGRLWGLGLQHGRKHILRSIYEGLAYAVADCFEDMPAGTGPVRFVGGGAKSRFLGQLVSDVSGLTLRRMRAGEGGALGAAMAAGIAVGVWKDAEDAASFCSLPGELVEPDADRNARYRPFFERYKLLRSRLAEEYAEKYRGGVKWASWAEEPRS